MSFKPLLSFLEATNAKPAAFSKYTAKELWTDEHTSAQMLEFHLNENVDISSRRAKFIDKSVRWMTERFSLTEGSRIVDFGCGPGLYTSRFARLNADIVGIDFSSRSINYARDFAKENGLDVAYVQADYLDFQPGGKFDLIIMIMCDFCALSPGQRAAMLSKFVECLADGGHIALDVYSMSAFAARKEECYHKKNQLGGFWAVQDYYAFVSSHKYEEDKVSLDKYTIIEEHQLREIYNWLQYFTPESLREEALSVGLDIEELYGDVAGNPYNAASAEFAAVLKAI